MSYEEKILTCLVNKYRSSKKDSGTNKIYKRTQIKPEKIYKKYSANDGDFDEINRLNATVELLEKRGYITSVRESFGTQIKCIYLIDEKVDEIERYLEEKYGFVSKNTQLEYVKNLIKLYKEASPICKEECKLLEQAVLNRKLPKNIKLLDDIFKAIAFIENNQEQLYIREVSMKIYGDSKYFEKVTLQPVCSILRKYTNKPLEDSELLDEILLYYHILREPQKICIKGNAVIYMFGTEVDISRFSDGIEIMASDLVNIESVILHASKFMTIENRTSYLRYKHPDVVTFYLGGYANRYQRDFIKMVYKANPTITYLHFGDIDPGGFWIHYNLCQVTGIEFGMFCMSVEELRNNVYQPYLRKLTDNDIIRLQELKDMDIYAKTVKFMLDNNVKLEQEIVSYTLMNTKK
ncbi:hypothetical protein Cst_c18980 [Thermoclostridium stercorarium subsp. stercorarium DSM 8532]|uniref:Wadjet protein JetD C-terminal domain-containing protein n=2 Tax=Thermoclostridium stercorarium TaxID=1510 RepID=L7VL39_THES1|nr:Wadjet anti-phage system protein JetD domain-containing protein [Thermoclostridium stercorarium]AGC68875.1 hypothetical protein Cst_c18980 [Thermoclostridium stercorarium subsp. stercorarium DSM 8532]AGI39872.1 DNA topoisomerase-6 subunit A [Thermoclostridium stercorarium subsp. stercorarium DSM 8532]ANW99181.1 hypothetical protein CSTERTH_09160 [Thermoclostridium stercorarium subsp. thermolacticum DSM 2910]UZQ84869.1 DUF2220 domain-containing protein [Thermoclostridium stercorarium]